MKKVENHIARKVGASVQERLDALKIGQKMQDLPEHLWHESFRYYVKEDPNRQGGPNMRLIRLDPNKPSLTVTAYIFNKFVHPTENRFVTVREAARLQGFPDDFVFKGTLTSTQLQVGNAVPPTLALAVFNQVATAAKKLKIKRNLRAISLFSGAGGMDIGAKNALSGNIGIDTKVAIEYWGDACETLSSYFGKKLKVIEDDICNLVDAQSLWVNGTNLKSLPDLVYGGPPCQAFSQAGKQKGEKDDRGKLIFEFIRFVKELTPSFFVMENVSNLRGIDKGNLLKRILSNFDSLGYNVNVDLLTAADYGAPQLRKRLFFIGCKKELGNIPLPVPSHFPEPNLIYKQYVTVGEAFYKLPKAEFSNGTSRR